MSPDFDNFVALALRDPAAAAGAGAAVDVWNEFCTPLTLTSFSRAESLSSPSKTSSSREHLRWVRRLRDREETVAVVSAVRVHASASSEELTFRGSASRAPVDEADLCSKWPLSSADAVLFSDLSDIGTGDVGSDVSRT